REARLLPSRDTKLAGTIALPFRDTRLARRRRSAPHSAHRVASAGLPNRSNPQRRQIGCRFTRRPRHPTTSTTAEAAATTAGLGCCPCPLNGPILPRQKVVSNAIGRYANRDPRHLAVSLDEA